MEDKKNFTEFSMKPGKYKVCIDDNFNYDELEPKYQISTHEGVFVHYLETIQTDLDEREN